MANEQRLIVESLKKYHDSQFTPGVYEHSIFGKAAMLLEADAVEVVHARWEERYIHNGKYVAWDGFYCSACGNKAAKSHYCPNCGTKMDGDGNDDV